MKKILNLFCGLLLVCVGISCTLTSNDNNLDNTDYEVNLIPTATYSVTTDTISNVLQSISNTSGLYELVVEEDNPVVNTIATALNNYPEIYIILNLSKSKITTISLGNYSNPTIKGIVLPETLITIGEAAFYECTNLLSINIPDSVTTIGDFAFQSCSELKTITIGKNVASLGEQAFTDCVNLKTVKWGDALETIGVRAFSSCKSLVSITIPNTVKTIKTYAFNNCTALKKVTIGSGVNYLYCEIFINCPVLSSVNFLDSSTWYRTTMNDTFTGGTKTDLTNASTNAKYFKDTYKSWYWYKE